MAKNAWVALACAALLVLSLPATTADEESEHYSLEPMFQWPKAELDVLIVPPSHGPLVGSGLQPLPDGAEGALPTGTYLEATLAAIENWRYAIDLYAQTKPEYTWLDAIVIRERVLAIDDVTPADLAATDILVIYPEHLGGGIYGVAAAFTAPDRRCIAASTLWLTTQSMNRYDMFKLAGHEFGHCLGIGHTLGNDPGQDMMSQGGYPNHAYRCPSNLDLEGIVLAFRHALTGQTGGGFASIPRADYAQHCMPGLV